MKKRLGHFRVGVKGPDLLRPIELVSGIHFNLDEARISDSLLLALSPLEYDLIHVGLAIYAIDRLVRKPRTLSDRTASRTLDVSIEVSDPAFWNTQSTLIARILGFLSSDAWTVTFAAGGVPLSLPPFLSNSAYSIPRVCLYSGGVDSAAGLALQLTEGAGDIVMVTAVHQPQQARRIRRHVGRLNQRYGQRLSSVLSRTALRNPPRMDKQELSQRCRSFLFCSLGGAVASALNVSSIDVYENGVGVLNLPPMTGMLWGGRATRGCHPHFLRMMGDLITAIANRRIAIHLPFKSWTKAEMVRRSAQLGFTDLIVDAVSCVHFPLRSMGPKQCGLCPGCVGTRQAMLAAGLSSPADAYRDDLLKPMCEQIPAGDWGFLRAQILQIADLYELTPDGLKPEILRRHLQSSRVATISDPAQRWVELLSRYRDEWLSVIAVGQEKGCHWASWIDGCGTNEGNAKHGGADNERFNQIGSEELQRAACAVS